MLGLHRAPEGLWTDLRPKMAKLVVTRELVGKIVCFSYVNSPEDHELLLNTRNNSGLLAMEIDKLHDRF